MGEIIAVISGSGTLYSSYCLNLLPACPFDDIRCVVSLCPLPSYFMLSQFFVVACVSKLQTVDIIPKPRPLPVRHAIFTEVYIVGW